MFALVRHEAHYFYPDALTPEGREAVQEVAKRLKIHRKWEKILTSPKQRTKETAQIISTILDVPSQEEGQLLERGDQSAWMPPSACKDTILVTHAPVIRELVRAWARHLEVSDPGNTPLGGGWIIDPSSRSITTL